MYTTRIAIILCIVFTSLMGCEEYEDYLYDYKFSAVYFATQKPLRTIVAYDEMQFKVGVTLAGKRENTTEEWAKYTIDPTLLTDPDIVGDNTFKLLPETYYKIIDEDNKMTIPKGEFIGDVTVTLVKDAFTSDPEAHLNTYALPLRIVETSADSVLSGEYDPDGNILTSPKDYTVLVVKYISPLHGVYYHKGIERELDDTGAVVKNTTYSNKDLSQNATWNLTTLGLNVVSTSGAGTIKDDLILTRDADNNVSIEAKGAALTIIEGSGTYNEEEREFYLDYKFSKKGTDYHVTDTLILRQPPEKDLRFEEW